MRKKQAKTFLVNSVGQTFFFSFFFLIFSPCPNWFVLKSFLYSNENSTKRIASVKTMKITPKKVMTLFFVLNLVCLFLFEGTTRKNVSDIELQKK